MDEVLDALDASPRSNGVSDRVQLALQNYAAAANCTYKVEDDGSIKIRRSGRDNDLSDIAIFLSMDCSGSRASTESALAVFSALGDQPLPSGLVLVSHASDPGHPSPGLSSNKPDDSKSGFETSRFGNGIISSYSAVLEVHQTDQEHLRLEGSPLLISKARKQVKTSDRLEVKVVSDLKTPYLRIEGPSAQQIALATIRDYSKYVAALFENFD